MVDGMSKPTKTSKPYGRQADDKTIKSVSIQGDIAKLAAAEAKRLGVSFSAFVEGVLSGKYRPPPGVSIAMLSALGGAQQSGCGGALVALAILAGLALCML
jgi:hypothetical protein